MDYIMGIDGGGSSVRVMIVTRDLTPVATVSGGSANPNSAGRENAAHAIKRAIRAVLDEAQLAPEAISGVGVGIAGTVTLREWARETVAVVLPHAELVVSSDFEIALVGARGERRGVLILAGTGSVIYGVNAAGEAVQIGGWGYLLGDEGSGYALGLQALQAVVRAADGRGEPTQLAEAVLGTLGLESAQDLIQWVYAPGRTREIAQLAPLVIQLAADDAAAHRIVAEAVNELALAAQTAVRRLQIESPDYAFAGGLLAEVNPLSLALCAALGLSAIPETKYPPVIGAALLAP